MFEIIIPWWERNSDITRARALDAVLSDIERQFENQKVLIGVCRSSTWSKAEAIADALESSTARVLVLWDADVICSSAHISEATRRAYKSGWAIPHTQVRRLCREATERFYASGVPDNKGPFDRMPYRGMPAGGLVAIKRELYDHAPFDARFRGWGHEDEAAGIAWRTLAGRPWRGNAPLWHLWHEPQPKMSAAVGSKESYELLHRYRRAAHKELIQPLLKESRYGLLKMRIKQSEV